MPSPFPGMDPFLEHPKYFPGLHSSLVCFAYENLQMALPEPYFAVLNERHWIETSDRHIEPDVDVVRPKGISKREKVNGGGLAIATCSVPIVIPVQHDEVRETFMEIRVAGEDDDEKVVTTVEVLSMSNKTAGGKWRDRYVQKQTEILSAETNLVEIDLLRGGTHTTAVPLPRLQREVASYDYHVCVYRCGQDYQVYPFHLEDALPEILVPLLPEAAAVPLDLQAIFERSYDAGPFRRRVKYDMSRIVPRLSAKQARWVKQQLLKSKRK